MKRLLITIAIILVAIPILMGGLLAWSYYSVADNSMPEINIKVLGQEIPASGYEWNEPVLWGLMFKPVTRAPEAEPENIGTLTEPNMAIELPQGYRSSAMLSAGGHIVWSGRAEDFPNYRFMDNGEYVLEVTSDKTSEGTQGYGRFIFRTAFSVQAEPRLETSADSVQQGDVLAVGVFNYTGEELPSAETDVGPVQFAPLEGDRIVAYVPVPYDYEGQLNVSVAIGEEYQWDASVNVVPAEYERQDISFDNNNSEVTEANSWAAIQQYNDTIPPLWDIADPEVYWSGVFVEPVVGRITTSYGLYRYVNGSSTPSRHPAIDIAAPEGEPVIAPNAGRVIFSSHLLNTGNTIVIEHGGGLKTHYFHLSELSVAEGDMVEQGQEIGKVGSTGASTGPHLHYEVRIKDRSINPTLLSDGSSGLYFFKQ